MVRPINTASTMLLLVLLLSVSYVRAIHWQHAQQLSDDFRLLWSISDDATDITFEMQARTHGYIGLGLTRPGDHTAGADLVIGWVDNGQTYLQDRHFQTNGQADPLIDPSQDCTLLLGYENRTHTVLRFRRALSNDCDPLHDMPITAGTQSVFYILNAAEPANGSLASNSLPAPARSLSDLVPMQLLQRTDGPAWRQPGAVDHEHVVDLRNGPLNLPMAGEALLWCRLFELGQFGQKHHIVRFEPLFDTSASHRLMEEIVLFECQGREDGERMAQLAAEGGHLCVSQRARPTMPCNAIVATWRSGSTGLTFPPEAGFPVDSTKERFYLMETQYSNREPAVATVVTEPSGDSGEHRMHAQAQTDNSGLRLHVTAALRPNDAGVLSLGINPEWRHIIPPGHGKVISEGHCVDDCTRAAFPAAGISIFAVLPQTKHIAHQVRLRHVRHTDDLLPLANDENAHSPYVEYRAVQPARRVLPGDRLVVECTYDSSARESITLGGTAALSETCQMLAVYWPRQRRLTECHSLPSLPTVLRSLGIEELTSTSPVLIALPAALAGITLESRILSYDWASEFENFQRATLGGSFRAFCTDARHKTVEQTDEREYFRPRVTKMFRPADPPQPVCRSSDEPSVVTVGKPKRHQPLSIADIGENLIDSMGLSSAASPAASSSPPLLLMVVPLMLLLLLSVVGRLDAQHAAV